MASPTVTVTVKYSKPGTQPPVYLAGSFSDPAWQPQEMEHTTNADGEHEYHKDVQVEKGKEYQYKFRLGPGDWWTLNEDAPTGMDLESFLSVKELNTLHRMTYLLTKKC